MEPCRPRRLERYCNGRHYIGGNSEATVNGTRPQEDAQLARETDAVSDLMLWLANITPDRIAATYNRLDTYRKDPHRDGGYVDGKYRHAVTHPVAWYLSLDLSNRRRAVALARLMGDSERQLARS